MEETILGFTPEALAKTQATFTATEIAQQPDAWVEALATVHGQATELQYFLERHLTPESQIILTGAGTSAFVGRTIKPFLMQHTPCPVLEVATTDLVSNPHEYFGKDRPTLLVSFARSGNSPESNAAIELANQCLSQVGHLIITCNPEGKLALTGKKQSHSYVILMPECTNDQSFAMTSSYTSMMIAALTAFNLQHQKVLEQLYAVPKLTAKVLERLNVQAKELVETKASRLVYLGSGGFLGLAQEAALKVLELTAGKLMATYDSPLGFRHGPKSLVNEETVIIEFLSNDNYTKLYDQDLAAELVSNDIAKRVVTLGTGDLTPFYQDKGLVSEEAGKVVLGKGKTEVVALSVPEFAQASDLQLIFPYIVFAQAFALHSSLAYGITPDNPCPTGEVNRVVQGVNIYPLAK
ncbi:SIS domain-containing protein [Psittacicella hinzii]|uniref:SIS domain-containing protein n=1 Tax=Psittacicella hinzii TaxID=2028575 RepID=A0A3A1YNW2_9GAMM|nr:SIS domain-containing protein [Psittacicella hinzii]RIY39241.1 hypothetical protein CKF58_02545 [Psittacicella hinzii]